jgi:hypothetical protein
VTNNLKPTNLLFILSDEHNKRVAGCYGHPMVGRPTSTPSPRADQRMHIEKNGGKEAILKRGHFRYSPPPGAKAAYY